MFICALMPLLLSSLLVVMQAEKSSLGLAAKHTFITAFVEINEL